MTKALSEEQKLRWKSQIQEQRDSGRSGAWWCRKHGLSYHAFLQWRKKFELTPELMLNRASFKELPDTPKKTGITMEYQQIRIHLANDFDPIALTKCLQVLKGAVC